MTSTTTPTNRQELKQMGYRIDWTRTDDYAAWVEGWGLFDCYDGEQIQRDDEAGTFAGDDDAWLFVLERARGRSRLHQRALAELAEWSPHELVRIAAAAHDADHPRPRPGAPIHSPITQPAATRATTNTGEGAAA